MKGSIVGWGRNRLKEFAHRFVFPLVESGYALLFRPLRTIARKRAQVWFPAGGERVLVLAPHPDDETLGCGGAIALHALAGDAVHVVVVTDGGSSGAGALGREEIARLRASEAKTAVSRLGDVRLTLLGLPEGRWRHEELVSRLTDLLERDRPHIIYSTSRVDFHPEHIRVACALASALGSTTHPPARLSVRAYEVQVPLTPVLANVIVPVDAVSDARKRALQAYTTQLAALAWAEREAHYLRVVFGSGAPVEVYWDMLPEQFREHMGDADPTAKPPFRGLRLRPLTDGLAWAVGIRHRRRLRPPKS